MNIKFKIFLRAPAMPHCMDVNLCSARCIHKDYNGNLKFRDG